MKRPGEVRIGSRRREHKAPIGNSSPTPRKSSLTTSLPRREDKLAGMLEAIIGGSR
jgi:hypothetical protein